MHFVPNVPSRPSLLIRVSRQVGTAFRDIGTIHLLGGVTTRCIHLFFDLLESVSEGISIQCSRQ